MVTFALIGIGLLFAVIISTYFIGKGSGKAQIKQQQQQETLDEVTETKKAIDKRAADSIDVIRQRMRKHQRD